MGEYIEREKALDFIIEVEPIICMPPNNKPTFTAVKDRDMVAYLESIPAADVRPVVRARWQYKTMTVPGGKGQTYAKWCCTAFKSKAKERTNFCPNCGAQMEES